MIICPINLPAGYELDYAKIGAHILSTIWLVPGGGPVYYHTALKGRAINDEALWTETLASVQAWVLERGNHLPPTVTRGSAVSDRPPPMEIFDAPTPRKFGTRAASAELPQQSFSGFKEADGSYSLVAVSGRPGSNAAAEHAPAA